MQQETMILEEMRENEKKPDAKNDWWKDGEYDDSLAEAANDRFAVCRTVVQCTVCTLYQTFNPHLRLR